MARRPLPPPTLDELKAGVDNHPRQALDMGGSEAAATASRAALQGGFTDRDDTYRKLLDLMAEKKTPEAVAIAMGWSRSGLDVFLSQHGQFARLRWDPLRRRMAKEVKIAKATGAAPPTPTGLTQLWTEEMRRRLLDAYVDTGDLLAAQTACGVTPSQFNAEVETNPEFGERLKVAKKSAGETLKLRAIQEGLGGNDKLLSLILREDGDDSGVAKLTDAQLARRLDSYLARIRGRIDSSRSGVNDQGGKAGPTRDAGGDGDQAPPQ